MVNLLKNKVTLKSRIIGGVGIIGAVGHCIVIIIDNRGGRG